MIQSENMFKVVCVFVRGSLCVCVCLCVCAGHGVGKSGSVEVVGSVGVNVITVGGSLGRRRCLLSEDELKT